MGECFVIKSGGSSSGASLNFNVVGGTTQPSSPSENTIWVNTSTAITSYVFSMTQPAAPTAGMVWIVTGTSSSAEFNALKKNEIQVLPQTVKQYVSGAWVSKTGKTYQNGSWTDWTTSLYDSGNEYTELTGGWSSTRTSGGVVTFGSTNIKLTYTGDSERTSAVYTTQKVAISGTKLHCEVNITSNGQFFEFGVASSISSSENVTFASVTTIQAGKTGSMTVTVDTSSQVNSTYYVVARAYGATTATISKIWMA